MLRIVVVIVLLKVQLILEHKSTFHTWNFLLTIKK